jgi:hypothetical protein
VLDVLEKVLVDLYGPVEPKSVAEPVSELAKSLPIPAATSVPNPEEFRVQVVPETDAYHLEETVVAVPPVVPRIKSSKVSPVKAPGASGRLLYTSPPPERKR